MAIRRIRSASVTFAESAKLSEQSSVATIASASVSLLRQFVDWAERRDAQRETQCARCTHQLGTVVSKSSAAASSMVLSPLGWRASHGSFAAKRLSYEDQKFGYPWLIDCTMM